MIDKVSGINPVNNLQSTPKTGASKGVKLVRMKFTFLTKQRDSQKNSILVRLLMRLLM